MFIHSLSPLLKKQRFQPRLVFSRLVFSSQYSWQVFLNSKCVDKLARLLKSIYLSKELIMGFTKLYRRTSKSLNLSERVMVSFDRARILSGILFINSSAKVILTLQTCCHCSNMTVGSKHRTLHYTLLCIHALCSKCRRQ